MDQATSRKLRLGVTWRAVLVGLILIPINSYWIFMTEIIRYQGHPTTISLFYSSIFNLVVLILLNNALKRYMPRWTFSQSELITIYVMLNIGGALVGHDSIQVLVSILPYTAYFKGKENQWGPLFADKLPDWLTVKDHTSVVHFYHGGYNLSDPANYGPWIVPVLAWSAFIVVLVGMFMCMNVLLRKQWTQHEKLSYPLVHLPLDMTAESAPIFRDKLFWVGFALVAAIDIINGLNLYYPSIPAIPIKLGDQSALFKTLPWSNIGWFPIMFYPFGIGLGMLLPMDLLFSTWFFFWVSKAERIFTAIYGYQSDARMPYIPDQSLGAYLGICVFAILVSRNFFGRLFRHFFDANSKMDDAGEPIRYRTAMWLLIIGSAFLVVFSSRAGLPITMIVPFFLAFFAMSIAITRMRAELGTPAHDMQEGGPNMIIPSIVGTRSLSTPALSVFSLYSWFNRAYRGHTMPIQLEGFKMAERTRTSYRGMMGAIMVAAVFGTFIAFIVILHLLYKEGASSARLGPPNVPLIYGGEAWSRMESWTKSPQPPDMHRAAAIALGFGVTMLLDSLRMRLEWFPFHPVGYAISTSWAMTLLWVPMMIAWLIKLVLLRYGGLRLYRQVLPFFLGVILAECVVGSLWTIVGIAFHVPSYAFWP